MAASVDAKMEEALNKIQIKCADDAEAVKCVAFVRTSWREAMKKIGGLEMMLANEKMEMYEDPLVIHAMHIKT